MLGSSIEIGAAMLFLSLTILSNVEIEGGNEMYGYISGGSFSICKLSMYRATIIRLPGQSMCSCQYHIDCLQSIS